MTHTVKLTVNGTSYFNAGCYRGMLYDRNTIGHHLAADTTDR